MNEAKIQCKIREVISARGGRCIKYHGSCHSEAGIPDLLICYKGRFLFIEVKKPGEKATKLQEHKMQDLINHGGYGIVADNVLVVEKFLDSIDKLLDI